MERGRIKVIDDDRRIARVLARILGNAIDTVVADAAEAALPVLERDQRFDG